MLEWGKVEEVDTPTYKKINAEIRVIINDFKAQVPKFKWGGKFIKSKLWEYPRAFLWLDALRTKLKRDITVIDFGCGYSPFPQFLHTRGFNVIAIDDNSNPYFNNNLVPDHYSGPKYWIGDIREYAGEKVDAIVSCSVIEHVKVKTLNEIFEKFKSLLKPDGAQAHLIDFYFPERTWPLGEAYGNVRVNFWDLANKFNFHVPDSKRCPESPDFDLELLRPELKMFIKDIGRCEDRVFIGDDIMFKLGDDI